MFRRERVIVERVIGQWKRRFPILAHLTRLKQNGTPTVILATAILHNIAKLLNDNFEELQPIHIEEEIDLIPEDQELQPLQVREAHQARLRLIAATL